MFTEAYEELLENKEFLVYLEQKYKERKAKERKEKLYYLKQRMLGLVMVGIGIAAPVLLSGDATTSLIAIPLGLALIFTRDKILLLKEK